MLSSRGPCRSCREGFLAICHEGPFVTPSVCLESGLQLGSTYHSCTSVSKWGAISLMGIWCLLEYSHQGILWLQPKPPFPLLEEAMADVPGPKWPQRLPPSLPSSCSFPLSINPLLYYVALFSEIETWVMTSTIELCDTPPPTSSSPAD